MVYILYYLQYILVVANYCNRVITTLHINYTFMIMEKISQHINTDKLL